MVPVILLAVLFVVQFSLAYYARTVLAGAAHDGAAGGARLDSSPTHGAELADGLIEESAGALFQSHSAHASSDGNRVTVTATGAVVAILPFLDTLTVTATGSAPIERFDPQGAP